MNPCCVFSYLTKFALKLCPRSLPQFSASPCSAQGCALPAPSRLSERDNHQPGAVEVSSRTSCGGLQQEHLWRSQAEAAPRPGQVAPDLLPLGLGKLQEGQRQPGTGRELRGSIVSHEPLPPPWQKAAAKWSRQERAAGRTPPAAPVCRGRAVCLVLASSRPPRRPGRVIRRITAPGFCTLLGIAARDCVT